MKPRWTPRFGIFARIYLFGLLLLVSMALAVAALVNVVVGPVQDAESLRVGSWIVGQVPERSEPAERRRYLRSLHIDAGVDLALYDVRGRLLVDGGAQDAPRMLDLGVLTEIEERGHFFMEDTGALAVAMSNGSGNLIGVGVIRQLVDRRVDLNATSLIGILAALALLAWPLARSLSVPIRRLSTAMTRFGRGDMDVRSGLMRHDELGELSRTFDEMAERILALLRAEKLLIAGVAHELRTPLQRIRIATELACDDHDEAARTPRQHFEAMLDDLRDLEHIITDVLTVARLETARAGASQELLKHREWTPTEWLLRECALKFEMRRPQRHLELELTQPLPEICIEPRLMAMAVGNLLDNAHEYSPVEAAIELQARGDAQRVLIEICDRGIGIALEHQADVFRPFYRTDAARTRSAGGAGLGLAIVKGVVEAHGGTVSVHSAEGNGARFRIELPCRTQPIDAGCASTKCSSHLITPPGTTQND